MRITYRVFLVGGIPITIAAAIALAAFVLLNEADRARSGAVLAGTIYRNLLSARSARDDFLETTSGERTGYYELFLTYAEQARFDLIRLTGVVRDPGHVSAAKEASDALQRYRDDMRRLVDVTVRNDGLVGDMAERANSLVGLTDEARERQHQSNADIVKSLAEGDRKLRIARDIVDRAHDFGAAIAAVALFQARPKPADASQPTARRRGIQLRARAHAKRRRPTHRGAERRRARSIRDRADKASGATTRRASLRRPVPPESRRPQGESASRALTDWIERLLKVYSTEQRALQDEVAELLTYSVQSAETERATQDIAIETLKLSNRTAAALTTPRHRRDLAHPRREPDAQRNDGLDADLAAHPVGDDRRDRPMAERARDLARRPERAEPHSPRDGREHPPHDRRRALPERDADAQRRADRRTRPQHPDLRRGDRPAARIADRPCRGALHHPPAAPPADAHDGAGAEFARRPDRRLQPPRRARRHGARHQRLHHRDRPPRAGAAEIEGPRRRGAWPSCRRRRPT